MKQSKSGYKEDASKLVKLLEYKDDETVLKRLLEIKKENKKDLAAYLKETQAIEIDADTIFDIGVKRLHEYKRQQLNALYIIDKYLEIKEGGDSSENSDHSDLRGESGSGSYVNRGKRISFILYFACRRSLIMIRK